MVTKERRLITRIHLKTLFWGWKYMLDTLVSELRITAEVEMNLSEKGKMYDQLQEYFRWKKFS